MALRVPSAAKAGRPSGPPGIRSVAKQAGVSVSSVSRFLNRKKRLSADTEQRILAAAAAQGYSPNRVAQSLRLKRTMTLGLLIPDCSNPYFSDLVKGAEDAARAAGFAIILFNSNEDREREQQNFNSLRALRCDGALVIAAPDAPTGPTRRPWMETCPVPLVCLDRDVGLPVDTVVADNKSGGFQATSHLIALGHLRIGLISVDYEVSTHRARQEGYHRALAEGGIRRRKNSEFRVPLSLQDGFSATRSLLALPEPPTAIFATSNALAIGTVAALKACGLRCPDDVSIIGYDSYDWQDVFAPRLCTVQQPAYTVGKRGTELLLDRVTERNTSAPQTIVMRTTLVLRDSCGPAPIRTKG